MVTTGFADVRQRRIRAEPLVCASPQGGSFYRNIGQRHLTIVPMYIIIIYYELLPLVTQSETDKAEFCLKHYVFILNASPRSSVVNRSLTVADGIQLAV